LDKCGRKLRKECQGQGGKESISSLRKKKGNAWDLQRGKLRYRIGVEKSAITFDAERDTGKRAHEEEKKSEELLNRSLKGV